MASCHVRRGGEYDYYSRKRASVEFRTSPLPQFADLQHPFRIRAVGRCRPLPGLQWTAPSTNENGTCSTSTPSSLLTWTVQLRQSCAPGVAASQLTTRK